MTNYFFEGIVEDVDDPFHSGRVRVRIFGAHTDNKAILPTDMLPWANVGNTIQSASISGVGHAPVGMVPGTMVYGIFRDTGFQEPFIMGTMGAFRQKYLSDDYGFNDPSGEFPREGVDGDMNALAGGVGVTGSSNAMQNNTIQSELGDAFDPTEPNPELNSDEFTKTTPWMPFAIAEIGVDETNNVGRIKEFHKVGGGTMQEVSVAWCASFINWCLIQAGITGTRSAASRSFVNFGVSVKDKIPYGAIAVFGVPGSGKGHVAFVIADKGDKLEVVGGNQSDKDHRSGGQVSRTIIPKNGKNLVLLDCRMPTNLEVKK
jgi:uncharacterized protein (TIGR02594 family)